jgi:NAD(P)H-flavin reductase
MRFLKGFAIATLLPLIGTGNADKTVIGTTIGNDKGLAEMWTCETGLESLVFDYTPLGLGSYSAYYDGMCGYPPAIGTLLLCAARISKDQSDSYRKLIFKGLSAACIEYTSYPMNWEFYQAQYENATKYAVPEDSIANISLPIYSPIFLNTSILNDEYIGYRAYYFNLDSGTWFSVGICGYFLLLIVISAIYNFARNTGLSQSANNSSLSKAIQKYIIFSPMAPNGKFAEAWGSQKWFPVLLPNRAQFIADVILFGLQMAFYCVPYRQHNGWFGSADYAWQRYVADRTGIMAFGKIPLLILFAGRNNFLLWVTGWSYATCLHFHKVLAWWMALDTLIHSVAFTIQSLGYYVLYMKTEPYFAPGVAATVICGMLLLFSMPPIRKAYYEYFFTFHVLLAIAFIVTCWYHCNTLGWLEWMIAASCVWFFDRLVRVIRMTAFGYRNAVLTVVGDDLFKVEVAKPSWWIHSPGTFSYIYFAGFLFWENHPFTSVIEGDNICAYIRVKKGVTYRMYNKLLKNGNQMSCKVCLEGPYGGNVARSLNRYEDALLLAGGSGVPGILENAASVNQGKLIWVAQTLQLVKAYKPLLANVKTDVEIYITREQGADKTTTLQAFLTEADSESNTDVSDKEADMDVVKVHSSGNLRIIYARPNIPDLIDSNVRDSPAKSVGIVACGPPKMMDEIRNTVTNNVTIWDKSIDFFDEFQIW